MLLLLSKSKLWISFKAANTVLCTQYRDDGRQCVKWLEVSSDRLHPPLSWLQSYTIRPTTEYHHCCCFDVVLFRVQYLSAEEFVYCSLPLGMARGTYINLVLWLVDISSELKKHTIFPYVCQREWYGGTVLVPSAPSHRFFTYLISSHALHFEASVIDSKVSVCWKHCSQCSRLQQTNFGCLRQTEKELHKSLIVILISTW